MNTPHQLILFGLPLLLAACQTPGTDQVGSVGGAKTPPGAVSPSPSQPQTYQIPSSADVDDLVAAALSHHPSLQATRARIIALEQSSIQARSLPDPMVSAGTGRMAETAAGKVVGTVGVQQMIPFPGKLTTKSLVALRMADAMRAQLGVTELALAERIRNAYWDYFAAHRSALVVTESKETLSTLFESVQARVAVNKANQPDLLRLQNEITRLDQRLATARGREQAARATLNALLYRTAGSSLPGPRAGSLREYGSSSALLSRAFSNHPEVRAGESRIAAAQNGVRLAELSKKPDFTAGLSYTPVADHGIARSATGQDQFMGTLGVTLPLWKDKNLAAERGAAASLSAEQSDLAATRSSLQQRIKSASASYRAERATLALYTDKLLPDARQTFDLTVTGYTTETATFLDLIDTWRQLLNYRLEYEENRARAGKADAALRFASGLP